MYLFYSPHFWGPHIVRRRAVSYERCRSGFVRRSKIRLPVRVRFQVKIRPFFHNPQFRRHEMSVKLSYRGLRGGVQTSICSQNSAMADRFGENFLSVKNCNSVKIVDIGPNSILLVGTTLKIHIKLSGTKIWGAYAMKRVAAGAHLPTRL